MSSKAMYRPEIDGLRSIAIIPVLIFHAGFGLFTGGYVGVDVFFVISGFLITGIIFREIEAGSFSFLNFYERRARRIFPALYLMLIGTFIGAWFFLVPPDFEDFSVNIISVVGFYSNITLWMQSDYFSPAAELNPLLHTWSLAVEEQYYLFFPILLIFLYKLSAKHILAALVAILLISLALSEWGARTVPTANYYLLPTRAWELFIGSVAALVLRFYPTHTLVRPSLSWSNALSILGMLCIATAIIFFHDETPFPSALALLPTIGAALVILYATPGTVINRLLSSKFCVGIGLISYSAYLWHQPIYAFARQQHFFAESHLVMISALLLSLLLAFLSWKFVEAPFRDKRKTSKTVIWTASGLTALLLIGIGFIGIYNKGFSNRFTLPTPLTKETFQLPRRENGWCFYSIDTNPELSLGSEGQSCYLGKKSGSLRGLLFGDSFAGMYEPFWDTVGKNIDASINSITTNWCTPSFTNHYYWPAETRAAEQCLLNRQFAQENIENYEFIILAGAWAMIERGNEIADVKELALRLANEFDKKVIIMPQPENFSRPSVMRAVYMQGKLENADDEAIALQINKAFEELARANNNIFYISRELLFNEAKRSDTGVPYSLDGQHISLYASLEVGESFIDHHHNEPLRNFLSD